MDKSDSDFAHLQLDLEQAVTLLTGRMATSFDRVVKLGKEDIVSMSDQLGRLDNFLMEHDANNIDIPEFFSLVEEAKQKFGSPIFAATCKIPESHKRPPVSKSVEEIGDERFLFALQVAIEEGQRRTNLGNAPALDEPS